jgi:hypothetical protein
MNGSIALLVIAAVLGVIWFGVKALKRRLTAAAEAMSSLLLEGESTTARVTATEKRRRSRGQYEYFVTYEFRARDGSDHAKELRVSATHFDDYSEGQPINIVYLARDPSVSATREMIDKARARPRG